MPQMSPISWLNLFLIFSALLLVNVTKNYFIRSKLGSSAEARSQNSPHSSWQW